MKTQRDKNEKTKSAAGMAVLALALSASSTLASTVFSDNFSRDNSATLGNNWTQVTVYGAGTSTAGAGQASILNDELNFTNDSTGSTANVYRGRTYAYQDSANFAAPYNDVLSSNPGVVTWTFNIEQNDKGNPTGFGYNTGGNYGAAIILAADTTNFADNNTTNGMNATSSNANYGYAVLWGGAGSGGAGTVPLQLVDFTGGIYGTAPGSGSSYTDIISGGNYANDSYLSVKVTYDPSSGTWSLYGESDAGFDDPMSVTNLLGSATDTTYTSSALEYYGALYNYANGANSGAGYSATFANLGIDVALPEPTSLAGLTLVGLGATLWRPRRRGDAK